MEPFYPTHPRRSEDGGIARHRSGAECGILTTYDVRGGKLGDDAKIALENIGRYN